ncbi:MAG: helix-turn-helix domain-containing protein [Gammaproteobacteria bacterium]|nr:DUF4115 domain-containing protein [Gammaproteobacteria bacterium]NNC96870.1 helix-turn-helix domain-containing protein [Gammaproteobacteria bacterium]NNM13015.1 helix-turn-helix domain-containing protein [Gammaproteobacteria bacterium]
MTEAENLDKDINSGEQSVRNVLSPGSMLRNKRDALGLELKDIARELNLDTWMLTAIEADEFNRFGAQVFAKGHLKHYAQHLGLNPDDVLFAYYQVAQPKETTPVIKQNLSSTKNRKSHAKFSKWFMRFLALLTVAALVYAAVILVQLWLKDAQENSGNDSVIPVPVNSAAIQSDSSLSEDQTSSSSANNEKSLRLALPQASDEITAQAQDLSNAMSEQSTNLAVALNNEETDLPAQEDVPQQVNQEPLDSIAQNNEPKSLLNVASNNNASNNVLQFNFLESSWIEVIAENGQRLIYGMANQGTVRDININGPTEIFLGNAQGTRILLNGSFYDIPANARAGRTARFVLEPGQ